MSSSERRKRQNSDYSLSNQSIRTSFTQLKHAISASDLSKPIYPAYAGANTPSHSAGSERIAILIDGSNLLHAAMKLGVEIDYHQLLRQLVGDRCLFRAYFYTLSNPSNEKQNGFLLWMRRNGFRVITRELVYRDDGFCRANLGVEIAIDMLQLVAFCGTVVLVSGDGNLAYAVEKASELGGQCELVSLRSMTSDSLLNVADHYTDLAQIAPFISRLA